MVGVVPPAEGLKTYLYWPPVAVVVAVGAKTQEWILGAPTGSRASPREAATGNGWREK